MGEVNYIQMGRDAKHHLPTDATTISSVKYEALLQSGTPKSLTIPTIEGAGNTIMADIFADGDIYISISGTAAVPASTEFTATDTYPNPVRIWPLQPQNQISVLAANNNTHCIISLYRGSD